MTARSASLAGPWISAALLAGAALLASSAPVGAAPEGGLPAARTVEEARVELGRRLFFDPVASRSGARSCASCHDPEHGFSDPTPRSDDDISRTRRHSQTLLDGHLNPTAHWDGEFDSIEELVIARLGRPSGVKGVTGVSAHGFSSEFGGVTQSSGGRSSGGGYGAPPTTSPPPSAPKDPAPPPPEPDDPAPADEPVTTPTEDGGDAGKDGGAKDGKADDGKGGDAKGEEKGKEEKDKPRSRAAARAKAPARVLPLDLTKLPEVAETIQESGRYAEGFQAAFGSRTVTTAKLAEAIAAYCRTIRSTEAPFDRHLAGDKEALGAAARRGFTLFKGRAGCVRCHAISGPHPTFTDYAFHNTGVSWRTIQRGVKPGAPELNADETPTSDRGRETISTQVRDRRAFKTATLRDLPRRGPYMHDGAFETLADVVRYYARGASNDSRQDPLIKPFDVTDQDVADLVAFLEALNGDQRPGLAPRPWHVRAERTRVRLVDARQQPLAGFRLGLVSEGDDLPTGGRVAKALDVVTDKDGWIEFVPGCATHTRLALPDGLLATGGGLVPDTCARAVVEVPVDGRVNLVVAFEPGAPAPERLVAEHEGTMRLPGHPAPRTVFDRVSGRDLDGRQVASYEGWLRTDVPPEVILRIPGDKRARPEHRLRLKDDRTLKLDLGS